MKGGFCFELYETHYTDCFIHASRYSNGNLQLSLFGVESSINETSHFADITLEQNKNILNDNKIVVDIKYKPELIPQLIDLGILVEQVGIFVDKNTIYPIFTIDLSKIKQNSYAQLELIAA